MTRKLLVLPLIALAAVLSGCLVISFITDEGGTQRDLIGDVRLTAKTCPVVIDDVMGGGPTALGDCPAEDELLDRIAIDEAFSVPHQIIVAYRVPKGTVAPKTLETPARVAEPSLDGLPMVRELETRGRKARLSRVTDRAVERPEVLKGIVHFQRVDLSDELKRFYREGGDPSAPIPTPSDIEIAGPGQEIVGYLSEPLPGAVVSPLSLSADFKLPPGAGGRPYAGPFTFMTFAGYRIAVPDEIVGEEGEDNPVSPDRPVECSLAGPESALCPLPNVGDVDRDLEDLLAGTDVVTRDLRIAQGAYGSGRQGETASVPFTLLGAGPKGGGDLALSATTTIPGGTATPRDAALSFPGLGDFEQPVTVTIPEGTPPGEYQVELVAKVGEQLRRAVGLVTVVAKQAVGPLPDVDDETKPDNLYMAKSGRIAFGYVCAQDAAQCRDSEGVYYQNPSTIQGLKAAAAQSGPFRMHRLGRKRFSGKRAERVRVKLKLYRSARRATRKGRKLRGLLVVRSGGKGATPTVRRVVISKLRG